MNAENTEDTEGANNTESKENTKNTEINKSIENTESNESIENNEFTNSTEDNEIIEEAETSPNKMSFPVKILFICIILFAAGWILSQFLKPSDKPISDTSSVTKIIKPLKISDTKTTKQTTKINPVGDDQVKKNNPVNIENHKTDVKPPMDTKTTIIAKTDKKAPIPAVKDPIKKESKKLNFPKKPTESENKKQAPKTDKAKSPAKEKATAETVFSFAVQVGAFKSENNAKNFALKLSKEGYPNAYVEQFEDRAKTRWNVVRLGQFEKKDEAFKIAAEYYVKHKEKAFVTYADAMMMIMK